ncbi:MAG: D-2-hydroxyacid dehydrogenase [Saprospirales bacterium]|nr:D-2-hydroxyacid dehydrogenase [Saprospirales bacterium]MBK8493094.1 D-2-hydroxyacid dehydrogenase [Saprospirales bacterium]
MIKILANDGIHEDGLTLLEEAGYQVDTKKVLQEDLHKVLPAYDVIIVRSATKVTKEVIEACPNLKIIARGGVGLDNIDVECARARGITVMNTPASSSQAVAELTFAHMFSLARKLYLSNRVMPAKGQTDFKNLKKTYSDGVQLRGKTLGILGFGRIGREVARIGVALGMHVLAVDMVVDEVEIDINVYNSEDVSLSVRVRTHELEEMLAKSDFITLHVPFSGGRPLITGEEISRMKAGVFLINTSRGGAIDELALLEGLKSGKIAGVGLDVFDDEPKPRKELLDHPKISVTPHIGASTQEAQGLIGLELADRILAFFGDDK